MRSTLWSSMAKTPKTFWMCTLWRHAPRPSNGRPKLFWLPWTAGRHSASLLCPENAHAVHVGLNLYRHPRCRSTMSVSTPQACRCVSASMHASDASGAQCDAVPSIPYATSIKDCPAMPAMPGGEGGGGGGGGGHWWLQQSDDDMPEWPQGPQELGFMHSHLSRTLHI